MPLYVERAATGPGWPRARPAPARAPGAPASRRPAAAPQTGTHRGTREGRRGHRFRFHAPIVSHPSPGDPFPPRLTGKAGSNKRPVALKPSPPPFRSAGHRLRRRANLPRGRDAKQEVSSPRDGSAAASIPRSPPGRPQRPNSEVSRVMPITLRRPGRLPLAVPALALCLLAAPVLAGVPAAPRPRRARRRGRPEGRRLARPRSRRRPPHAGRGHRPARGRSARRRRADRARRRRRHAPALARPGSSSDLPAGEAAASRGATGYKAISLNAGVAPSGTVDPTALRTSFNQSIRADRSWALGTTGKGVGVAVIDTGIAGGHPDFRVSQTDTRSRVIATAVTNPGATSDGDTYGHGTHVAGLIAGNGTNRNAGDPLYGRYAGVAPDANLISVKVDDGSGATTLADVIAGLQFVVDFRDEYNIRVVNLSLRSSVAESYKTDPLDAAVEQAWFAGIVVVAAAGNGGAAEGSANYSPGNDPHIITVGAVDDMATKDIADDRLTSWSTRGSTQDGFEKPEVVAPGAHLVCAARPRLLLRRAVPVVRGRRRVPAHRRHVDVGGARLGRGRGPSPGLSELDAAAGQGDARQAHPRRHQPDLGDAASTPPATRSTRRRSPRRSRTPRPRSTRRSSTRRPRPRASRPEHPARSGHADDRLEARELEPRELEPGAGRAARELQPRQLVGGRLEPRELVGDRVELRGARARRLEPRELVRCGDRRAPATSASRSTRPPPGIRREPPR